MTGERGGEVWDALWRRGQIRIYPSDAERAHALAQLAADATRTGNQQPSGVLMMADTREQTTALNGAIRDRLLAAGHLDDTPMPWVTKTGERLGVGDRVATRRNDRDLGVTNRETWTITAIGADGDHRSLTLRGRRATDLRTVPAGYAREHVELAYATTVYGAQGETTSTGHFMFGEHTSAASAYVAMTRGRDNNVAHLVAENLEDARRQWADVFGRDRADLGPAAAAEQAAEDIERYGTQPPTRPLDQFLSDLWATWTRQADLHEQHQRLAGERNALQQVAAIQARYTPDRERFHSDEVDARRRWLEARQRVADPRATVTSETADLQTQLWAAWRMELSTARRAAEVVRVGRRATGTATATGPRRRRRPDRVRRPLAPRRARPGHRPCRARRPGEVAARAARRRPPSMPSSPARSPRPTHADRFAQPCATPTPPTSGPNGRAPTSRRPWTPS